MAALLDDVSCSDCSFDNYEPGSPGAASDWDDAGDAACWPTPAALSCAVLTPDATLHVASVTWSKGAAERQVHLDRLRAMNLAECRHRK
jgi:hypothetical protein